MFQRLLQSANYIYPRTSDFIQLLRWNRPIGIYLLLWPTLVSLWIAGDGSPSIKNIFIFVLGVILMRSAGCAINDFADRKIDGHVERTKNRPLATGKITPTEAVLVALVFALISFILVLFTNTLTMYWSFAAIFLAAFYPFSKRYTYYPQLVLGMAYSCGILLAHTAESGGLPKVAWIIFSANLLWTIAYDTYYAMSDREDDLKIGVKSTAVIFGSADRIIILILQLSSLAFLAWAGLISQLGTIYYLGLAGAAGCFAWEFYQTRDRDAQACFKAFLHNHWAGMIIFIGLVLSYLF